MRISGYHYHGYFAIEVYSFVKSIRVCRTLQVSQMRVLRVINKSFVIVLEGLDGSDLQDPDANWNESNVPSSLFDRYFGTTRRDRKPRLDKRIAWGVSGKPSYKIAGWPIPGTHRWFPRVSCQVLQVPFKYWEVCMLAHQSVSFQSESTVLQCKSDGRLRDQTNTSLRQACQVQTIR